MCFLNRFLLVALLMLEIATWMPGIEMVGYTPMRFFAAALGLVNACIRPFLLLIMDRVTFPSAAISAFLVNAAFFFFAGAFYLGVHVASLPGGVWAFCLVWCLSTVATRWIYIDSSTLTPP